MMNPIEKQFNMFMQQMKGQDPNQLLNQLVSSGKISQNQINQAHKQVENFKGQLDGLRKTFGL